MEMRLGWKEEVIKMIGKSRLLGYAGATADQWLINPTGP